ncbi:MAG: dihydropteroate synthase [Actinomycetota bacterium]|jgi:dihydropteroate synthase|nr:dihydropteroate synthase [Actinomycetota bacterium]
MAPADAPTLRIAGATVEVRSSLLMGVVNASLDSFSDGGRYRTVEDRVALAGRLVAEGAAIVDVGGQSLIRGEPELAPEAEISLVVPVIEGVARRWPDVWISVDTYKPPVAEAALAAGAHLVNDVSGLRHPEMASVCARAGASLVIAHMDGRPKELLAAPVRYDDIVEAVHRALRAKLDQAVAMGVDPEAIVLDPGPDLAKTPAQTVALLRRVDDLRDLGRPLLLPLSRKDFLGAILQRRPLGRDAGTLAAVALAAVVPGNIFRVHDVGAAADVVAVVDALTGRVELPPDYWLPPELRREPR